MPRDSNGNYSLPNGYQATPGATILASQHNPPLEDLAAAMTNSLPRDGSAPMSGPLKAQQGSAASPSIQSASAPGVGFWFDAAGVHVAGDMIGARYIGELIPWTDITAPRRCVIPIGQTLSRTTYPDLWAFAQVAIANGSNFYNNGNGATTFGIGDLRGRVIAMYDQGAGRLTPSGNMNGNGIGSVGGNQLHQLVLAEIPLGIQSDAISINLGANVTSANWVASNSNDASPISAQGGGVAGTVSAVAGFSVSKIASSGPVTGSVVSQSGNTGGGSHFNVQPTITLNYALYTGVV